MNSMPDTYRRRFLPLEERFWSNVNKNSNSNSCWLWQGYIDQDGYGRFPMGSRRDNSRKTQPAHRVAYELCINPIGQGLYVDHICKTRNCVNPKHLHLVTPRESSLLNNNSPQARNKRKTHCKYGHPLEGKFLQIVHRGERIERHCRECKRIWMANHRARK